MTTSSGAIGVSAPLVRHCSEGLLPALPVDVVLAMRCLAGKTAFAGLRLLPRRCGESLETVPGEGMYA
jgi:hypothetical protein